MVNEVSQPYVDKILSMIGAIWKENTPQPFISSIVLPGGGAILLGGKVKHKLVKVSNDPLWDEAKGMKVLV
jgi:hypothetical protein